MSQEVKVIQKALSLFSNHEKMGLVWSGKFVSLSTDLRFWAQQNKNLIQPAILIQRIIQDIWNIGTLIHRLSWFRTAPIDKDFLSHMWMPYASVDIEHFHVELRSIMDYTGEIISHVANKHGQVPDSFNKLFYWVARKQGNRKRLGEDLALVVESAAWFPKLRGIRNALIHSGGFTLVFGSPKDGILFQVYKDMASNLIEHKTIMFNEKCCLF